MRSEINRSVAGGGAAAGETASSTPWESPQSDESAVPGRVVLRGVTGFEAVGVCSVMSGSAEALLALPSELSERRGARLLPSSAHWPSNDDLLLSGDEPDSRQTLVVEPWRARVMRPAAGSAAERAAAAWAASVPLEYCRATDGRLVSGIEHSGISGWCVSGSSLSEPGVVSGEGLYESQRMSLSRGPTGLAPPSGGVG